MGYLFNNRHFPVECYILQVMNILIMVLVPSTLGYTYTMTDENSQYPQNVFQKGNEIYWMPDGAGSNLRDADGNIIKLPKTDKTVINIQVMTGETVNETFQLCLDKEDHVCTVTLKEIDK